MGFNGGVSHGICRWAVAGTGFNGCMQEQQETIFESAGELKVLREIRGSAENGSYC